MKSQNPRRHHGLALLPLALCGAAFVAAVPAVQASSHREAPYITNLPKVDGTDFYMFRSYEVGRENYVTFIANYQPLQDPYGGPNYFQLDPTALYEIHVSNDGKASEALTFQFRFQNTLRDNALTVGGKQVSIPLMTNGSGDVNSRGSTALNVRETYTIDVIRGDRRSGAKQAVTNLTAGGATFDKPFDHIGEKSISNYIAYANKHIYDVSIPGCATPGRVFVGQRKDPFVVNLGEIFDLVNVKFPATELNPAAETLGEDLLSDANVTSIIMEVPINCLTTGTEPVIGAWTTASLPATRALATSVGSGLESTASASGDFVQVSRLGMPLVNEVVIGLKDKNKFNASQPKDDAQFADYVTNPTLPALLEVLFGSAGVKAPTNFPRTDLVAAFLTGVAGVNQPANVVPSEMLRLNTTIAPTRKGAQKTMGVLAGDNAGFPNGRRPGDDVVDIELRVAMGRLCILNITCKPGDAPAGALNYTDGAALSDRFFDDRFPYLRAPLRGSPNPVDAAKRGNR